MPSACFWPRVEERAQIHTPAPQDAQCLGFLGWGRERPSLSLFPTLPCVSELCAIYISTCPHLHETHRHTHAGLLLAWTTRDAKCRSHLSGEKCIHPDSVFAKVPYVPDVHIFRVNFLYLLHSCPFPQPLLEHSQITCLLAGIAACSLIPLSL